MKRKKKPTPTPAAQIKCKNCPTNLILDPDPPPTDYRKRHGLCTKCMANEIDALNEKLSRGGIINEDVETQNTLMVKALQFYGDKTNYGILGGTRMRTDKGTRAREALASGLSQDALGRAREALSLMRAATGRCPECDTVHQPLPDGVICHACTS